MASELIDAEVALRYSLIGAAAGDLGFESLQEFQMSTAFYASGVCLRTQRRVYFISISSIAIESGPSIIAARIALSPN
jgi:hypothetical protein